MYWLANVDVPWWLRISVTVFDVAALAGPWLLAGGALGAFAAFGWRWGGVQTARAV